MPQFKTTKNILFDTEGDELFDENWMDTNKVFLPPNKPWDYNRELQLDDIQIWEVLTERGQGKGLYAAWDPYAEYYMVTTGWYDKQPGELHNVRKIETYYGPGAQNKVMKRIKELGWELRTQTTWVDEKDMWLYNQDKTIVHNLS